jgi:hypothetical protein
MFSRVVSRITPSCFENLSTLLSTWLISFFPRLCSTTQNSYITTISKRQFTSIMPMFVDEETMFPTGDSVPSFALVGRYLYDYASLLLEYHNAVLDAVGIDEAARYAMILRFDGELRATSNEKVPKALSSRMPLNPAWPKWVKWARKPLLYTFNLIREKLTRRKERCTKHPSTTKLS